MAQVQRAKPSGRIATHGRIAVIVIAAHIMVCPAVPAQADGVHQQTWVLWWQSQRRERLDAAMAKRPGSNPARDDAPVARQEAMAALLHASTMNDATLRAEAALGLGRLGESAAVPRLAQMLEDRQPPVRRAAWLALGLIGDDAAQDVLLAPRQVDFHGLASWMLALGLLSQPRPQAIHALLYLAVEPRDTPDRIELDQLYALQRDSPRLLPREAERRSGKWEPWDIINWRQFVKLSGSRVTDTQRLAVQALSLHLGDHAGPPLAEILETVPDPVLASQAILTLGRLGYEPELETISELYSRGIHNTEAPVARRLHRLYRGTTYGLTRLNGGYRYRDDSLLTLLAIENACAMSLSGFDQFVARRALSRPMRQVARQDGRSQREFVSLVPAPGDARPGYVSPSYQWMEDGVGSLPFTRRYMLALISLGAVSDEQEQDLLYEELEGFQADYMIVNDRRACAAVGLGLSLARLNATPAHTPEGHPVNLNKVRRRGDKIRKLLGRKLGHGSERVEVKAACALALGLGGSDLERVVLESADAGGGHDLVRAHVALGLALTGSASALEHAGGLLPRLRPPGVPAQEDVQRVRDLLSPDRQVAQRAAADAMGMSRDDRAASRLMAAYAEDGWVAQAVVAALARMHDRRLSAPLGQWLLSLSESPRRADELEAARLAAWSLGELFDTRAGEGMARLSRDVNFTMPARVPGMLESPYFPAHFAAIDQPFLYRRLCGLSP